MTCLSSNKLLLCVFLISLRTVLMSWEFCFCLFETKLAICQTQTKAIHWFILSVIQFQNETIRANTNNSCSSLWLIRFAPVVVKSTGFVYVEQQFCVLDTLTSVFVQSTFAVCTNNKQRVVSPMKSLFHLSCKTIKNTMDERIHCLQDEMNSIEKLLRLGSSSSFQTLANFEVIRVRVRSAIKISRLLLYFKTSG